MEMEDSDLVLRRDTPGYIKILRLMQALVAGALVGFSCGTLLAFGIIATGALTAKPALEAARIVLVTTLTCASMGALASCCLNLRSVAHSGGLRKRKMLSQARSIGTSVFLVVLAVLVLSVHSTAQQQVHVYYKVFFGVPLDPLPASYCMDAGAAAIDGVHASAAGGGTSTQNVRRLSSAMAPPWWRTHGADAASAARNLSTQLTQAEQLRLIQGVGWAGWELLPDFYVGSMYAIPRLGIPSITMQDAGQGFRTIDARNVGRVTAWPCLLAVAATWDVELTRRFAAALGDEFKAKGANVILGPSVNVHHIARNGRNAEYLSGEDPVLGAALAAAYVHGVQSAGVAATAKHFVLNSQETSRNSESSEVSDRALWEVFYPPFEAAVRAGAAAFMCSYNRVNGTHACGDAHILIDHLRDSMGFDGFVMSDWWAVHDVDAARNGVDQNLPGNDDFYSLLPAQEPALVAQMTERILRGMLASGVWDEQPTCVLGCDCSTPLYEVNATSPAHDALAIEVAADSAVLLKNEGGVLPLRPHTRVALVGRGCTAPHELDPHGWWQASDYYVVGGSGRVITTPERAPTIEQALSRRGVLRLNASGSDRLDDALAVAEGADVVVACAGGTATEAVDRASLALDQHELLLALGPALRSRGVPLVVAAMAPGTIEAPWANDTAAALIMFLAGQGTGEAWARILLGEVAPSGKLPVTIPYHEAQMAAPCETSTCVYHDALRFGWTAHLGMPVAFPFGHGLSYAGSFRYAWAPDGSPSYARGADGNGSAASLSVVVTNMGTVAGRETAQLYVTFPANATGATAEPGLRLRTFEKTPVLQPGEAHVAIMTLDARDFSVWDAAVGTRGGWRRVAGEYTLMVGSSSRDPRLQVALRVT